MFLQDVGHKISLDDSPKLVWWWGRHCKNFDNSLKTLIRQDMST